MNNSPITGLAPNTPLAAYGSAVSGAGSPGANTPIRATSTSPLPAVVPNATQAAQKVPPTPDELKTLVADIQRKVASVSPELQFTIDQQSGQPIVSMTDKATKEVLWQFPSDEVLQVRKALDQYQRGTLVNHKA